MQPERTLDVVGVGIGPFNLSVASLLAPLADVRSRFIDAKEEFRWHPGLLFDDSALQVSFLKDLVMLADPTSEYSFVSFLVSTKRVYRFLNADFARVSRREFDQYLRWVCSRLKNLEFANRVEAVQFTNDVLRITSARGCSDTRNLVLGIGLKPTIPACARPHLGNSVFHAANYLSQTAFSPAGRRIAVIGGGQTGAEVVAHLIGDRRALPREIHWISRRSNYLPMDESAFTNEFFAPAYCEFFHALPERAREVLLREQNLASNGVSSSLLQSIYRRLYELEFIDGVDRFVRLAPACELAGLARTSGGWLVSTSGRMDVGPANHCAVTVDTVILCTGWHYELPSFLEPLQPRLHFSKRGFAVRHDFSVEWDGPGTLRIFVQNAARNSHGIADPNLSLMAWRSARIINSLMGRVVYDVSDASSVFDWSEASADVIRQAASQ